MKDCETGWFGSIAPVMTSHEHLQLGEEPQNERKVMILAKFSKSRPSTMVVWSMIDPNHSVSLRYMLVLTTFILVLDIPKIFRGSNGTPKPQFSWFSSISEDSESWFTKELQWKTPDLAINTSWWWISGENDSIIISLQPHDRIGTKKSNLEIFIFENCV